MCELINLQEISTLDVQKYVAIQPFLVSSQLKSLHVKKKGELKNDFPYVIIFYWFFKNCGLTPFSELYGLTCLLIDPDDGMYESIDIHEVSTFNQRKYVVEGIGIRFSVTKHELMTTFSNGRTHPYGFYSNCKYSNLQCCSCIYDESKS